MKPPRKAYLAAALMLLIGITGYMAISERSSSTFGGAGFAAMSSDQVDVIYSDMAAYLRRNGFTESPGVPGGGVRSEGAIQRWFVRKDGWNRETAVRVDVQDRLLHTYVHWEAHGTPSKVRSVEHSAYQVGVDLLDWLHARPETNEIPRASTLEMRQGFLDRLTTNKKS